jgi:hypothetical protein
MDGVAAVRAALVADTALAGLVPDDRVIAGPLPLNVTLPALSLMSISKVDLNTPAPGATRFVRERVQVMVYARNYPQQKEVMRAVRHAAADKINFSAGEIRNVTIHTDSAGPDLMTEDASVWIGSQDLMTTYTEQR